MEIVKKPDYICEDCRKKLPYIHEPRCLKCGKPLRYQEREYCYDCRHMNFHYEQGRSVWVHKGVVRQSIYGFKYHNRRIFAESYAKELIRLYRHTIEMWNPDLLIPVPLHPRRRRKRGYNQAEILADYLGEMLEIQVENRAVYRNRYTKPQKVLDDKNRQKNLHQAFGVREEYLKQVHTVLVIDDIYTTGATIEEMAKMLKKSGVKKVYFVTISIGQGF